MLEVLERILLYASKRFLPVFEKCVQLLEISV